MDMRKLNARPKHKNYNTFDQFWAKMAEMVEGRVNDRRHGKFINLATHVVVAFVDDDVVVVVVVVAVVIAILQCC